jgi:hypothetical protein
MLVGAHGRFSRCPARGAKAAEPLEFASILTPSAERGRLRRRKIKHAKDQPISKKESQLPLAPCYRCNFGPRKETQKLSFQTDWGSSRSSAPRWIKSSAVTTPSIVNHRDAVDAMGKQRLRDVLNRCFRLNGHRIGSHKISEQQGRPPMLGDG